MKDQICLKPDTLTDGSVVFNVCIGDTVLVAPPTYEEAFQITTALQVLHNNPLTAHLLVHAGRFSELSAFLKLATPHCDHLDDPESKLRALIQERDALRTTKRKMTIEVSGGVATCTSQPDGVEVEIIDHDNERAL